MCRTVNLWLEAVSQLVNSVWFFPLTRYYIIVLFILVVSLPKNRCCVSLQLFLLLWHRVNTQYVCFWYFLQLISPNISVCMCVCVCSVGIHLERFQKEASLLAGGHTEGDIVEGFTNASLCQGRPLPLCQAGCWSSCFLFFGDPPVPPRWFPVRPAAREGNRH